jgi:hypothetical protein
MYLVLPLVNSSSNKKEHWNVLVSSYVYNVTQLRKRFLSSPGSRWFLRCLDSSAPPPSFHRDCKFWTENYNYR